MFNDYYKPTFLGRKETGLKNPVAIISHRFTAKKRTYLVRIEEYNFGFYAIKYCDIKDKNNKINAYQKIFNDGDAFKVIGTCIYIMHQLWIKNNYISFAFYAVPRSITLDDLADKKIIGQSIEIFFENYKRARFNIYEYV